MDRKYRQRGYQDSGSDRQDRPRSPQRNDLSSDEKLHRKGLRHAIDRDAREVVRCHNCGRSVSNSGVISRETECPNCRAALHCCRICLHFDTAARHQCRTKIQTPVGDKTRANDCTLFEARLVLDSTGRRSASGSGSGPASNDPRSQFENLFKR